MTDHWKANGLPVYMAVSGYLGLVKPRDGSKKGIAPADNSRFGNLEELASMFESSGGVIQ